MDIVSIETCTFSQLYIKFFCSKACDDIKVTKFSTTILSFVLFHRLHMPKSFI